MDKTSIDGAKLNVLLQPYRGAIPARSYRQLVISLTAYSGLWIAMYLARPVGYWLTLLLAFPAAAFLVRLFMIQHDCGHGSFFRSQRMANIVGFGIGVMTLVPYEYWRKTHAIHHATSGNLDLRSFGDIVTLTVGEYRSRSRWGRLGYRLYRNPLIMLLFGPVYQFVLKHRYPADIPRHWTPAWRSVHRTNVALVLILAFMWLTIGLPAFFAVQIPIVIISGALGVWLFYVQHQFEDTYWHENHRWDFFEAGMQGSSYYRLPRPLQWLTANIGLHHIHHINSRIPNYRLPECFAKHPELQQVTTLTMWDSLRCLRFHLWDENAHRMISFADLPRVAPT